MRSLIGAVLVSTTLVGATSAFAADLPVKAPPMAVDTVYNWTGFYVGVNAGYGWANSEIDPAGTNTFCNPLLGGCGPGVFPGGIPADVASARAVPPAISPNARGGLVGGTIGYNKQFGSWVAGLEADLAWANITGSDTRTGAPVSLTGPAVPGTSFIGTASASTQIRDFGTVRGRLGYTPSAALLLYGTGGLAYGQVSSSATITEASIGPCGFGSCPFTPAVASTSSTRVGWTLGAGAEYRFMGQWSLKAEYLYYDLGRLGYAFSPLASTGACGPALPCPFTSVNVTSSSSDIRGSIIRIGLNYSFGNYGIINARY